MEKERWMLIIGIVFVLLTAFFCWCYTKKSARTEKIGWLVMGLLAAAFAVIGVLAALDFERAFVVFHSVFFPGKTNWVFDWYADPIIRVLPQEFFMDCAILIGLGLITMAVGILVWES